MTFMRMMLAATVAVVLSACGGPEAFVETETDLVGEETGAELTAAQLTGRFEVFQGLDGQWYFNLVAGNGEKVLQSEGYTTKASAQRAIGSVKTHGVSEGRYLQREASDGSAYFVLTSTNGQIIGVSQMYATASNAKRGAATVLRVVASTIEEVAAPIAPPTFETFKGLDGKWYFHLRAANGEIVLQSQGYTTKASATNGITSVSTNGVDAARYQVRAAADGKSYFVLRAGNNLVIGRSQTYVSTANAERGAATVTTLLQALVASQG